VFPCTAWLFAAGAALGAPITVEGSSACPSPAQVDVRLRALVPPSDDGHAAVVARVDPSDGGVVVSLRDAAGNRIGERTLPRKPSCDAMAAGAAIMIAAWHRDVEAKVEDKPPAAPPAMSPTQAQTVAPPPRSDGQLAVDAGVGLGGGWSGSWAPGAFGSLALTPWGRGVGLTALFAWEARRNQPLSEGSTMWTRASAALGVHYRAHVADIPVDIRAAAGLARFDMTGAGFAENRHQVGLSPGFLGGVRVFLGKPEGQRLAVWVDTSLAGWTSLQAATELSSSRESILPSISILAALGVSVGRF